MTFINTFTAEKKNDRAFLLRNTLSVQLKDFIYNIEDRFSTEVEMVKVHGWTKAGKLALNDGNSYFVKKYDNTSFSYKFRSAFRASRPFKVIRKYYHLESHDVPTTKPFAALASRSFGFIKSEYLITDFVKDVSDKDFYRKLFNDGSLMDMYVEGAVSLISRMHKTGMSHGDCKMSNFYVSDPSPGNFCMGIWDLDGSRYFKYGTWSYFIYSDIARLAVSVHEEKLKLGYESDINILSDNVRELYIKYSGRHIASTTMENHVNRFLNRKGLLKKKV